MKFFLYSYKNTHSENHLFIKKIFTLILFFSIITLNAQLNYFNGSTVQLRVSDALADATLFSNKNMVAFNEVSGELKMTLNTATLTSEMFPVNNDFQLEMDAVMPADSLLIEVSAIFAEGQLSVKNQSGNLATYQIPAYVNYRGIQYPIMMTYSYGASMVKTANKLYLNISFEFAPNPDYPLYIPFINFYPTIAQFDVLDATINYLAR